MFELPTVSNVHHPHCGSRLAYTEPRPGVPQFTSTGINFCSETFVRPNFEAVPCARGGQISSLQIPVRCAWLSILQYLGQKNQYPKYPVWQY
jgi:hypothetical protein